MTMPLFGLKARRFWPEGLRTIKEDQPALSEAFCVVRPEQTASSPSVPMPATCWVAPEVLVNVNEMGRQTKST